MTIESRRAVTVRFAGDSGDGMQLTGAQYASASALAGNDLATFPDYPAEIRAPAGTLAGVSGFQLQFSSDEIFTPGDDLDALVAMNPAALQHSRRDLRPGGIIIVDTGTFTEKNLVRAGFDGDPTEDDTLAAYRVVPVDISNLTVLALEGSSLSSKEVRRCKNFFALGIACWLYSRPVEPTRDWLDEKFASKPDFAQANKLALQAGYNFGITTDLFQSQYEVPEASIEQGVYRQIDGNQSTALGLIIGSKKAGVDVLVGGYPITPASTLLQELAKYKPLGLQLLQAEDEIAAVCMAIGASYAGRLGVTLSSGPGIALKGEALGLAVILELPLVVVNVQRGGPSTGLPTKTEQSDLMQAMFGRSGTAPMPVLAPCRPNDAFDTALEAVRIAVKYMTPVFILSDGYIGSGTEPWKVPDIDAIEPFKVEFRTDPEGYLPYGRNEDFVRDWVRPGTPGLEHRVGGLEKSDGTGNVSFDRKNHQRMTDLRGAKIAAIADDLPPAVPYGPSSGELLVVGWGSTFGSIRAAVTNAQLDGLSVAHLHLRHINPFPKNLGDVLNAYERVLVPELNTGQLVELLRAEFLLDLLRYNKVEGAPFRVDEIREKITELTTSKEDPE